MISTTENHSNKHQDSENKHVQEDVERKSSTKPNSAVFPSTSFNVPLPSQEVPVFNKLMHFRHTLSEFCKRYKHLPATFDDINRFSVELGTIMEELRRVRFNETKSIKTRGGEEVFKNSYTLLERNKIDDLLDYVWVILFKEWVHIAGIGEAFYPIYTKFASILRQLDLMKHAQAYTLDDLQPFEERLYILEQEIIEKGGFKIMSNINEEEEASTSNRQSSYVIEKHEKQQQQHHHHLVTSSSQGPLQEKNKSEYNIIESAGMNVPAAESMISSLFKRVHRNLKYMISFASSVPPELVDIHEELAVINKRLKFMDSTDEFPIEDLNDIIKRLNDLDSTRIHDGIFLPVAIAQASTLALLFQCFDLACSLKLRKLKMEHSLDQVNQDLMDLQVRLSSMYNFERFNVSVVNLREIETKMYAIRHSLFDNIAFKISSGESKLVLYHRLAQCHHLVRLLLLGVEDLSESLLSMYEDLVKLSFQTRDDFYKAIRHEAGHDRLHVIRSQLQNMERAKKNDKGIFIGDACNPCTRTGTSSSQFSDEDLEVPRGQTIIKALIEEMYAKANVIEAWVSIF